MSNIVEFAGRGTARTVRAAAPGGGSCEIVIFPGVRYERWASEPASPPNPDPAPVSASGKKRRRQKV